MTGEYPAYINDILDAPKDDGGSSITSYCVEICKNLGKLYLLHTQLIVVVDETYNEVYRGKTCSCEIKGLSAGTSCKSRVCAVSEGGVGPVRYTIKGIIC